MFATEDDKANVKESVVHILVDYSRFKNLRYEPQEKLVVHSITNNIKDRHESIRVRIDFRRLILIKPVHLRTSLSTLIGAMTNKTEHTECKNMLA